MDKIVTETDCTLPADFEQQIYKNALKSGIDHLLEEWNESADKYYTADLISVWLYAKLAFERCSNDDAKVVEVSYLMYNNPQYFKDRSWKEIYDWAVDSIVYWDMIKKSQ